MKKRILSILLVLCLVLGMLPAVSIPAAAADGAMELPKVEGSGSGAAFIYYNFVETTTFTPGVTYAFLDARYSPEDAVAQLGSGAVLEATNTANNCTKYINRVYGSTEVAAYVNVVEPGKGFDHCPTGGLYQVPSTSNPIEYRYFCRAGGAQNCGPLYAYTYDTAEITWEHVTVSLNDPGNTGSSSSADYTVKLTYDAGQSVTLDSRSYTVTCSGKTASVVIADNDGNTISGAVTLPCGVVYQPGGLNVSGMPANQGMLSGGSVQVANGPTRTGGYLFQYWEDAGGKQYLPGDTIAFLPNGDYTLTAVWKDIQAPAFTCDTVEVTTGTSGSMVRNAIEAAMKITDNEPVSGCTVTVDANDDTAAARGEHSVAVTVTDAAGNSAKGTVTLQVLPGPLALSKPAYENGVLSATLQEPGPDAITETGIVWGVISSPTTAVNNGNYTTDSPATEAGTSFSTPATLAEGVLYYARAYAKVDGITYYGPQATIGENIPAYGVFTITNHGSNTFTVSRTGGADGAQTVYFRTVNGSAVGGVHFLHQSGQLTFADGQSSATITIDELGVNTPYDNHAATGYSNASREYSVEIYRVDGGAVIEDNRDVAIRTMTGNQTVDSGEFTQKTQNGDLGEKERGDFDKDGEKGWTENKLGAADQRNTISVQPAEAIRAYVQAVSSEVQFYVTFEAREEEKGYQAIQIVPGSTTDTAVFPYQGGINGSYSAATTAGYTALFEHGGSGNANKTWYSYHFPAESTFTSGSTLTTKLWKGAETAGYIAFPTNTQQITTSYGASGDDGDTWYTKNVVYHYQFIDITEPRLLTVASMGDSTYRAGDPFTVSLVFDEIVDGTNSDLSGKTISTSWGTATYAGGANTNVLYFTGTVPADATGTLAVYSTDATIKDMANNGGVPSVGGSVTANVDTKVPSFDLSAGSISGGVGQATISNANANTSALRYAWSQSSTMPATGWIPLTGTELEQAKTAGFTAMTRQESGTWYLHVLGICEENGALAYEQTSVTFSSGNPELVQPPTISATVHNDRWAVDRTITVNYANGTAEYRYGDGDWQTVTGNSVIVHQNGTYAFRCVSSSGEAATASAEVEKIDTTAPIAAIGAMTANDPTQKNGVYHSITLPVSYMDAQSGVESVQYAWSSSSIAPADGWIAAGSDTELTYTAAEAEETPIYLHLKVTDQVGNTATVTSQEAYPVISTEGADANAPAITIGLAANDGDGFTAWDGTTWTNETQTLEWKLVGGQTDNCVVTLPDGRTTTDTSGTILVSQNGEYTVSVVDQTYGGSNSASYTIEKIDTAAPTVSHDWTSEGWQPQAVSVLFTFADGAGSGLHTAQYAVVEQNTETPTELTAFSSNTGGRVTVSQDGQWYIYYEVTDQTAGTYGDGTPRAANTTSGFVGPIQINTGKPALAISGGETGASSLTLTVISDGDVTVARDGGTAEAVNGSYTVTEPGTYAFTATSNAGLSVKEEVQVYSITFDSAGGSNVTRQLVIRGGTATEPTAPVRAGYTFDGWYDGAAMWDFQNGAVKNHLDLTAKWTLNTPTVELKADQTSVTYGDTITLTAETPYAAGEDVSITYAWYQNGSSTPVANESGPTLTLSQVAASGSYTVQITVRGDGQTQTATSDAVAVQIVPRPVVLHWDYTAPIPYDGQTHTVTASIANLVESDSCELTYDGMREAAAVGSYETAVIALGNPNYTLDGVSNAVLQWQIGPASGEASVTMEDWTYGDAAGAPVPASDTNGIDNVTYRYTGTTNGGVPYDSAAVPSDAGTYTVTATFGATENHEAVTASDGFTIAPRPVQLAWSGETNVPYDGQPHAVTATITNLVGKDVCDLIYEDHQKTDVGTYTAKVIALGNPNYTLDGAANTALNWEITSVSGDASVTMEDWIYGQIPKTPVPASATNGTDNVTYSYTGTTSGGVPYNSAEVPTDAGSYTVTATFAATANHEAVTATDEFTIARKTIAATWSGLTQVYQEGAAVQAMLSGVVDGDEEALDIQIAGAGEAAGQYELTATLSGVKAVNYTLKNGTATMIIQPKPVLFTVSDNVVQADGSQKEATVAVDDENCTYTVTYRQNGQTVSAPKAAGTYEIWVEIHDSNYRHTDGSGEAQVGTLTIADAPPTLYTVTFAGGAGAAGAMAPLDTVGGSVFTLPACGFTRDNAQFTGWLYDGKTYQPGDRFTMPNGMVTVTAQWQTVFTVDGTITDGETAKPAQNAVVSLWLGATKVDEVLTENGKFRFEHLIPGIYNLVVTKDVRTVTSKVEIQDQDTVCNATLPKGATNSIVKVTTGSPDIVVGNLDTVFHDTDETVYTTADQTTVSQGGKVEFTFIADEKHASEVGSELDKIKAVSGSSTLSLLMDYAITKSVTDSSGTTTTNITQSNVLLEVRLPLPTELQGKYGYQVYRVHEGKAETLSTTENELGEYFTVSGDKTTLILYIKCFSTYAIGYTEFTGGGGGTSTPVYPPNIERPEHGTVAVSPQNPQKDSTVTITATPEDGYTVDTVTVTDSSGKPVAVTPNEDGTYTFVQPSGKVTITVTFRPIADPSDCPRDESCPMAPFTDADRHAWYHDGVHYCVEHGLMLGTGETTFAPGVTTTRGMIVTILWRLEGSPIVSTTLDYDDVKPEDWYGEAVRWADSAGVVTGYGNGKFGPNDPITREQMAAMLWRYAGSSKVDGSLASFVDGAQTSDWARPAMIWAVDQGLIAGVGNQQLVPRGQATRAQAATILMRFALDMVQ